MKTAVCLAMLATSLFACALANAQVLGGGGLGGGGLRGGLDGGLEGATFGGMRNPSGIIRGNGQGNLGADLDASGARRATSEADARAKQRATDTASSVGHRARGVAGAAGATAAGSATAAAGQAQSSAQNADQSLDVMGGIGGSLDGNASWVKERQMAAPAPAVPVASDNAPATPSGMLDVGASKQQSIGISGADRETQLTGQGSGVLNSNATQNGVSTSAQGSGSISGTSRRSAGQPAQ